MFVIDMRHDDVWSLGEGFHETFRVVWFKVTQNDANLIMFDELDIWVRTDTPAIASLARV